MPHQDEIPPKSQLSAVRRAANALRQDVIDKEDGALLGSEDELIARYGVSRPTLRQAAALVSQEHLLRIKRGVGGGYFANRPASQAVAHVAAVFLHSRKTKVREILEAVSPIRIALARLAATSECPEARARLAHFVEQERERGTEDLKFREFLRAEREFGCILGELSDNKVISLFLDILYDFSAMLPADEDLYIRHPDRVLDYRARRNRLAEALLDGDEELAALAAKRCGVNASEWLIKEKGTDAGEGAMTYFSGQIKASTLEKKPTLRDVKRKSTAKANIALKNRL